MAGTYIKSGVPFASGQRVAFDVAGPETISTWRQEMAGLYSSRNAEYRIMRQVFDGDYVSAQASNAGNMTELQDRHRLKYNMINTAVRRYMDEMSAPVEMFAVPRGVEQRDLLLAEKRQKLVMDWLRSESATLKIVMAAHYQGLLDKAVFHVRPDPTRKYKLALDLIVPEYYYPVPESGHWFEKRAVIVSSATFKMGDVSKNDADGRSYHADTGEDAEYWDAEGCVKVEGGMVKFRRKHNWGFIPFEEVHNIPIPHRQRGQGDGDQSVGLNEYLNLSISDQADVLSYLANPIVVVRGSKQGTGGLLFAPRAIWELEREGSAEILTWAGSPPSFETQVLRIMQGIEDSTGLSAPAYGREVPSGVSGEAIRSILAGFNTRTGAKQTFMGVALARICEKAQAIWELEYPNEEFEVSGEGEDPDRGMLVKPSEFKGWYQTRSIFQPQNETVRVFTELEKLRSKVQSRLTTMRRLGIPNPDEEDRRILIEAMQDSKIAQMTQLQAGGFPGAGAPGSPPGLVLPNGQPIARQPMRDRGVQDLAKELQASNPGNLNDLLGLPGMARRGPVEVSIRDVQDALDGLQVSGKVYLEGGIVEEGRSAQPFTVRVENEADIPQLQEALGDLMDRARFVTAKEEQTGAPRLSLLRPRGR